jgi:hypothetical protein
VREAFAKLFRVFFAMRHMLAKSVFAFRSPCKNKPVQFPSLKLRQTLKHLLPQSSKYHYTALLCGLGIVTMFVPAVATKSAEPPSQPQQRKIDSFGTVSRRLPDMTLPVTVRNSASLPQKRKVENVTLAEPAKPAVSQPILKRRMNMNERVVVTFAVGRMTGEAARIKTKRALLFNDTGDFDYVRVIFGVDRYSGSHGNDENPCSKRGKGLGKAKYVKLTDHEKLLAVQTFDQLSATCASDNASIKELRKLTMFSNVTVFSISKWRTELSADRDKESPAVVNNK